MLDILRTNDEFAARAQVTNDNVFHSPVLKVLWAVIHGRTFPADTEFCDGLRVMKQVFLQNSALFC